MRCMFASADAKRRAKAERADVARYRKRQVKVQALALTRVISEREIADALGVAESTVYRWGYRAQELSTLQAQVQSAAERIATKLETLAGQSLDRLGERIPLTDSARDLAYVASTCIDKTRLLRGESTETLDVRVDLSDDEAQTELSRLARAAKARATGEG